MSYPVAKILFTIASSAVLVVGAFIYNRYRERQNEQHSNERQAPKSTFDGSNTRQCGICLSELENDVISLPCKHRFHRNCMALVISNEATRTCPYCRRLISAAFIRQTFGLF